MATSIDDIISRNYANFRGVDFSNSDVSSYRSPNSINMWKNYEDSNGTCIETRPSMKLLENFGNQIFGLFFYKVLDEIKVLVHTGTKLVKWDNYPKTPAEITELYTGLNPAKSQSFVYNNIFFLKDGINYIEYDGEEAKDVEPTIPITSIGKKPTGEIINDNYDTVYQPVNVLTSKRKNGFVADGTSTEYYLDTTDLDSSSIFILEATVNGISKVETLDFEVDRVNGIVKFFTAPPAPTEAGESNVFITFSKTGTNYKERINKCTLLCEFDNRIFFSGNQDYPNALFHSELNDPRYIRDTAYYEDGLDLAPIKAIIPGNNVLWVIKEINQNTTGIYYHTPTIDSSEGKVYPGVSGNINVGCVSTGINFNDDIVFFSKMGLEGINGNVYSEQLLAHRSSLVDSKLLNELNYEKINLCEYKGYLLCLINSHIYLADSRQMFTNNTNQAEYEWYYWEFAEDINYITEYQGNLFLGNAKGNIYKLDSTGDEEVYSSWTTSKDDFDYPAYIKTTNKRGGVATLKKLDNDDIQVSTIVDDELRYKNTYSDKKGYIAYRIKDKKFKAIQIQFSSNKPFGLFSCTLQGFVAGYIKR
jgi:hypothetical protein